MHQWFLNIKYCIPGAKTDLVNLLRLHHHHHHPCGSYVALILDQTLLWVLETAPHS